MEKSKHTEKSKLSKKIKTFGKKRIFVEILTFADVLKKNYMVPIITQENGNILEILSYFSYYRFKFLKIKIFLSESCLKVQPFQEANSSLLF